MPELPDITVYLESLQRRIGGHVLQRVRVASPFLLRTAEPPIEAVQDQMVTELRRIGKRIAIGLENDVWLVLHLMIAGRLHWRPADARLGGKASLAALDFEKGSLVITEAGAKKRASLHLVRGESGLTSHDPGGLEVLSASLDEFLAALTRRNHTLRRALTDPTLFSGIGNAYSDEILHRARLSPVALTQKIDREQCTRLYEAVRETLTEWTERLRRQAGERFPEKVTAFRPEMAVHGRYGEPCPVCGTPVQRIRYAENETNYCPRCQTGGKILADRSLSRLLKSDWPRSVEELETPP
ncbi:MAG: formamidopyrimidine-DNA glycosylase [Planctomycetota bacterium]|nr:MAG: formamidopyrimidine-DNA glycosylase [Planctomycetota bacterium]REK24366.1 MAG: formamidopyrimidine-DNA glycosylase [Planctomycetota bacterium]REK38557.1 MAG: formamidopyrimidine-DNA glycosylase [Planctomycetota bacterium]